MNDNLDLLIFLFFILLVIIVPGVFIVISDMNIRKRRKDKETKHNEFKRQYSEHQQCLSEYLLDNVKALRKVCRQERHKKILRKYKIKISR